MARGKKKGFKWTTVIDHGGKKYLCQGDELGASGESMIRGAIRENNYGRAEIALLGNCVRVIKLDQKTLFNRDKGGLGDDIPSPYDAERDETLAERLLTYLCTNVAPHVVEQFEDCFGRYYDEEEETELDANLGDVDDPLAGSLGGSGVTESPGAGATSKGSKS